MWLTDNTYKYEDLVRMMGEIISALDGKIRVSGHSPFPPESRPSSTRGWEEQRARAWLWASLLREALQDPEGTRPQPLGVPSECAGH